MSYKPFYIEIQPSELLILYDGLNKLMDDTYMAKDALEVKKKLEEAFRKENNL